jgi:Ser/Thr protein kinase RdoA (MazF antagonist)
MSSPRNLPFGWRNRNVVVYTSAGKMVLKHYKAKWPASTILHEHSILLRLEELNFPAPRLISTRNGETLVRVGEQHFALFSYIAGTNLAGSMLPGIHRRKLLAMAGQTLARFHRQLNGFLPTGQHHLGYKSYSEDRRRDLAWHLDRLKSLREKSREATNIEDKTDLNWLAENSNFIQEKFCQLEATLQDVSLPRLVIHGDYGLHNLQFHHDGTATVHDFELARLEWRLIDLVAVLSRMKSERSRYFMPAYQKEYPLTADEWHFLPQVWQFYKLQGAVQYWNTFFELGGSYRLVAARNRINQADWATIHQAQLLKLRHTAEEEC